MTTNDSRTAQERAEEPDALQRAKELAEKYIPLHNWDPVNEEPVETYGYPETQRHGFQQGYLAFHAELLARDAEPTTVSAEALAEAWEQGAEAAWSRSTPAVNGQGYKWRHGGEPKNPYIEGDEA